MITTIKCKWTICVLTTIHTNTNTHIAWWRYIEFYIKCCNFTWMFCQSFSSLQKNMTYFRQRDILLSQWISIWNVSVLKRALIVWKMVYSIGLFFFFIASLKTTPILASNRVYQVVFFFSCNNNRFFDDKRESKKGMKRLIDNSSLPFYTKKEHLLAEFKKKTPVFVWNVDSLSFINDSWITHINQSTPSVFHWFTKIQKSSTYQYYHRTNPTSIKKNNQIRLHS